jgi:hypothetical protein
LNGIEVTRIENGFTMAFWIFGGKTGSRYCPHLMTLENDANQQISVVLKSNAFVVTVRIAESESKGICELNRKINDCDFIDTSKNYSCCSFLKYVHTIEYSQSCLAQLTHSFESHFAKYDLTSSLSSSEQKLVDKYVKKISSILPFVDIRNRTFY